MERSRTSGDSDTAAEPASKEELSPEQLEAEAPGELPDRHEMSLIDANVTIPASPALAADVLADTLEDAVTGKPADPSNG
jgi:hypothetical protein